MKQQRDSSKKVKKMRLEKSYPNQRKRMNSKGKSQGKRGGPKRHEDDYNTHDDFFDFD